MDAGENIPHWFFLLPVSLKYTFQLAGLTPNIRWKFFTDTLQNLYITRDNHFRKKDLQALSIIIEERSNFPRLSVYRIYTSCTGKSTTLSIQQPFKQKMLHVGIFTQSHSPTSWYTKNNRGKYLESYGTDKVSRCYFKLYCFN